MHNYQFCLAVMLLIWSESSFGLFFANHRDGMLWRVTHGADLGVIIRNQFRRADFFSRRTAKRGLDRRLQSISGYSLTEAARVD